jgi:hypothetical protein
MKIHLIIFKAFIIVLLPEDDLPTIIVHFEIFGKFMYFIDPRFSISIDSFINIPLFIKTDKDQFLIKK